MRAMLLALGACCLVAGKEANSTLRRPRHNNQHPKGLDTRNAWTKEGWAHLMGLLVRGRANETSPVAYPHANVDILLALSHVVSPAQAKDMRVAVISSITPWVEAAIRHYGFSSVVTVDYNPPSTQLMPSSARVRTIGVDELRNSKLLFDVIVSFSGIEHDGLGRYGDPVDENGDLRAIRELAKSLAPAGVLLLGMPVGPKDAVCGSRQRIYGPRRFPQLVVAGGFGCMGASWDGKWHASHDGCAQMLAAPPEERRRFRGKTAEYIARVLSGCDGWRHQPVFVLRVNT
mmetsp:Transcript_49211/g.115115  ORF Transcript_49211/g.115115 Transcript_49211/m.115115 type:complete len:288 (-) Transcript_49211:470-1333(-)